MPTQTTAQAFLFTDIVGSTARYEKYGDTMRAAQARHDAIIESSVAAHGGRVFKHVGDQCCVRFGAVQDATRASVLAQRKLADEAWSEFAPDFEPLSVRMAVHFGRATAVRGDYFGVGLSQAARLVSATHGGQILLSPHARDRLIEEGGDPPFLREWGPVRLRDFRGRISLYQVLAPGMPDVNMPPAAAVGAHLGDLVEIVPTSDDPSHPTTLDTALDRMRELVKSPVPDTRIDVQSLRLVSRHQPADLHAYLLTRIAVGLDPRLDLDDRFVELNLILDRGGGPATGRWEVTDQRFGKIDDALEALDAPIAVLLGAPGSGKTTVMRRLELDLAIASFRGEPVGVPFFLPLSMHGGAWAGDERPQPMDWLREQWSRRYPRLPSIEELMASRRVILLLDGLNEIPHSDETDYRKRVLGWRAALHEITRYHTQARILVSCRSLDYSAPLSSPVQRVPQLRLLPMTTAQIQAFLKSHLPAHADDVWREIRGAPWLDVVRSPFFLRLLVEQVQRTGDLPSGRADLLTRFVREAIVREVDNANPLITDGNLLRPRDMRRLNTSIAPDNRRALRFEGPLIEALARIAWEMQHSGPGNVPSQVRIPIDTAVQASGLPAGDARRLIRVGENLGLLEDDPAMGDVTYTHHLFLEYFAARHVMAHPDPTLAARPWHEDEVHPNVAEVLADLEPGERLPPLATTRWEETFLLATALMEDPGPFIGEVARRNLPLAGQCAAQPCVEIREDLKTWLRTRLAERARAPDADLRARLEAASAVSALGHPSLFAQNGPEGRYVEPDWVEVPPAEYPIGDGAELDGGDQVAAWSSRHKLLIDRFAVATYPVTNREWHMFMEAGGYENVDWWPTEAAAAWRTGAATASAARDRDRSWRQRFKADPDLLGRMFADGVVPRPTYDSWTRLMSLSDDEFEAEVVRLYPGGRKTEPEYWGMPHHAMPIQPVVGISWFEALAYTRWLSANLGYEVFLPSEVEWEAAARGGGGRRYAWGDEYDPLRLNSATTHIGHASPIGVFPRGDTPDGVTDMCGNVWEWTRSLWGTEYGAPSRRFRYPYDPRDGREVLDAGARIMRVIRGGCWTNVRELMVTSVRDGDRPGQRANILGMRLATRH